MSTPKANGSFRFAAEDKKRLLCAECALILLFCISLKTAPPRRLRGIPPVGTSRDDNGLKSDDFPGIVSGDYFDPFYGGIEVMSETLPPHLFPEIIGDFY